MSLPFALFVALHTLSVQAAPVPHGAAPNRQAETSSGLQALPFRDDVPARRFLPPERGGTFRCGSGSDFLFFKSVGGDEEPPEVWRVRSDGQTKLDWLAPVKAKGLVYLSESRHHDWHFVGKPGTKLIEAAQLFHASTGRFFDLGATLPKLAAGESYRDEFRFTADGRYLAVRIRRFAAGMPTLGDVVWVDTKTGANARVAATDEKGKAFAALATPSGLLYLGGAPDNNDPVLGNLEGKRAHRLTAPDGMRSVFAGTTVDGRTVVELRNVDGLQGYELHDFSRPEGKSLVGTQRKPMGNFVGSAAGGAALVFESRMTNSETIYTLLSRDLKVIGEVKRPGNRGLYACDAAGSSFVEYLEMPSDKAGAPAQREAHLYTLEALFGLKASGRFVSSDPKLATSFLSADPRAVIEATMAFRAAGLDANAVRDYVRANLKPERLWEKADKAIVDKLPEILGNEDFTTREGASNTVKRLIQESDPEARTAIARKLASGAKSENPETRARAESLLRPVAHWLDADQSFDARLRFLDR